MTPVMCVTPVLDDAAHRAFCALPLRLHAAHPQWVPPVHRAELARWAPDQPALAHRRAWRFMVQRGDRVVGRIAAIEDPAFAARWAPGTGFFGFFECESDIEAARALFDEAGEALAACGLARMVGPVQLTTHDEVGLLVDGFDDPPMVMSPWNPPYYRDLVEASGCTVLSRYHSWLWTPASMRAQLPPAALEAGRDVVVRASDPARWDAEIRVLFELYNDCFADNWGFVPATWDEFAVTAGTMRTFYRPDLALFADLDGGCVGFALTLPDVNQALAGLHGVRDPIAWLRLVLRMRRINRGRLILLGVRPAYRRRGVGARLVTAMAQACEAAGMRSAELSLMHEDNRAVRGIAEAFGNRPWKQYALYERRTRGHGLA